MSTRTTTLPVLAALAGLSLAFWSQAAWAQLTPFETMQRGVVAYDEGRYAEAISDFTEALKTEGLPPGLEARLYYRRGLANQFLERAGEAVVDYTTAITLHALSDDVTAVIHYNRALAYDDLKKFDLAIADLDQAVKLKSEFPEAYNNRANLYRRLGRYDQAIADFNTSVGLKNPMPHLPLYGMGLTYEALGDPSKAEEYFKAAYQADPNYEPARERVASLGTAPARPAATADARAEGANYIGEGDTSTPEEEAAAAAAPMRPATGAPAELRAAAAPEPQRAPPARPTPSMDETRLVSLGTPPVRSEPEGGPATATAAPASAAAVAAPAMTRRSGLVVQLAAYSSEERAMAGWKQLNRQHEEVLKGFEPVITEVTPASGETVYRLQVGPMASKDAALALCNSLKERGLSCIVRSL